MRLHDKVAIVTGSNRGIGSGIAAAFLEEGARVACIDLHHDDNPAAIRTVGNRDNIAFFACDVACELHVDRMVADVLKRFGRIDILVNNAGVNFVGRFEDVTIDEWDRVLGVDLRGTFLCSRACIRALLTSARASVVNIASVHTLACLPGAAPYDAAKWGVVGMTKALAVEYATRGVRFNCLSPGLVDTQIWRDIQASASNVDDCLAHWRANIPMGRVGTVREVAQAAVFLASDEASYITGANLVVDGGMTSQLISADPAIRNEQ